MQNAKKKMKQVILHCSDSSWGNASVITKWHLEKGWDTIGYNYVILNGWTSSGYHDIFFDGHIESGRNPETKGAHCKGHNEAIGVCLIGKPGLYTNAQFDAVQLLLLHLKNLYERIEVHQHSEFDDDKYFCASLDLEQFKDYKYKGIANGY